MYWESDIVSGFLFCLAHRASLAASKCKEVAVGDTAPLTVSSGCQSNKAASLPTSSCGAALSTHLAPTDLILASHISPFVSDLAANSFSLLPNVSCLFFSTHTTVRLFSQFNYNISTSCVARQKIFLLTCMVRWAGALYGIELGMLWVLYVKRFVSGLQWVTDECLSHFAGRQTHGCVAIAVSVSLQFIYVGLSCVLVWTVLSVCFMGMMSLVLFLISLFQFLYKNLCIML